MILKALSSGAQHGYGISSWIGERTEGELAIEEGALYQALHRLAHPGWGEGEGGGSRKNSRAPDYPPERGVSENTRRARYYRLTRVGRRELRDAQDGWRRYARAVSRVLDAPA